MKNLASASVFRQKSQIVGASFTSDKEFISADAQSNIKIQSEKLEVKKNSTIKMTKLPISISANGRFLAVALDDGEICILEGHQVKHSVRATS